MSLSSATLKWAGAAALVASAWSAMAHDEPPTSTSAAAPAQAAAPQARTSITPTAPTADAQIVVKDADSGQLRAATPEEAKALQATRVQPGARAAIVRTLPKTHPSGARGARLTDEFASYAVAVRRPDGTVAMECFGSPEEAAAAVKAAAEASPAGRSNALPTE